MKRTPTRSVICNACNTEIMLNQDGELPWHKKRITTPGLRGQPGTEDLITCSGIGTRDYTEKKGGTK